MSKKKGLGKGLGALLSNQSIDNIIEGESREIKELDLDRVIPNEKQPRKNFSKEALEDLSRSIEEYGLLQPIIVRPMGKNYQIIAGERRYRASKLAGKDTVAAIVKDLDDFQVDKISLIENIQREDLSVVEEAKAYDKLLTDYKLTQQELSDTISKSRSHIANTMRLLNLDREILDMVDEGKITKGHARGLLAFPEEERIDLAREIVETDLKVRDLEERARLKKDKSEKKNKKSLKTMDTNSIFIKNIEEEIMDKYLTKVKISDKNGCGEIKISYYNYDDLNRILDLLK